MSEVNIPISGRQYVNIIQIRYLVKFLDKQGYITDFGEIKKSLFQDYITEAISK